MFTDHECSEIDAHRERTRDDEDRCRKNVTAPSGVEIGCARHAGHRGLCETRWGLRAELTDADIEHVLERAVKAEDIELVVECENALTPIQRPETRRAARARVADLLAARGER